MAPREGAQGRMQIKGIRDGLLVSMSEGAWPELREALLEHIQSQGDFLKGARFALDVGSHVLRAAELGQLRDTLSEHGITLWAVLSSSPTTEATAQTLGMATRIARPRPERTVTNLETNLHGGEAAILVRRTLRSGYSLQHPGHVVVIGDVNPGAEILAGGSVVVWGRLRGSVQAGVDGEESVFVCALDLSPTQLRIADHDANPPQKRGKPQPEMVQIKDGRVVFIPWTVK